MDLKVWIIQIEGNVQGVGFRPFVYRLAHTTGTKGYIRNTNYGVEIISDREEFARDIKYSDKIPANAIISKITIRMQELASKTGMPNSFEILESTRYNKGSNDLLPDIGICKRCLKEIKNKKNRRHDYFFTTCTDCGPRYSITRCMPYDRNNTSMDRYRMCDCCSKEYSDPKDTRFHSQTIACDKCGPKLSLKVDGKSIASGKKAMIMASKRINEGEIIAIRGIGGYHLCCDAYNTDSVESLRHMIKRPRKPLAIMVEDTESAKDLAKIDTDEIKELESGARPIAILKKEDPGEHQHLSRLDSLGIMLPATALQQTLIEKTGKPLVMTSCNMPGDPIQKDSQDIAQIELSDDREIISRVDDSIIKIINGKRTYLRSSRGYAPITRRIKNPDPNRKGTAISLGASESASISILKDGTITTSQQIGDTRSPNTLGFMEDTIDNLLKHRDAHPNTIICDMHPGYETRPLAEALKDKYDARMIECQHHIAHAYSVALEECIGDFVAIAADGSGYGDDNTVWGGEIFEMDSSRKDSIRRAGHLEQHDMIGNEKAIHEPSRMLFSILSSFVEPERLGIIAKGYQHIWSRQKETGFNTTKTTSAGRILDAASSLLGICQERTYTGEPAMMLESFAGNAKPYKLDPVIRGGKKKILMTTPLFRYLWDNMDLDRHRLAATVQAYLADGLISISEDLADGRPIIFSGGVAYNRQITGRMIRNGIIINKEYPAGDGGISAGQIGYYIYNDGEHSS